MRRQRTVWIFGPLPPPVSGAARVTDLVRASLASCDARIVAIDTGDGGAGPAPVRQARRLLRMSRGLGSLLVAPHRSGAVYIGGAGGELLWFQAIVVMLARVARLRIVFHHHNYAYLTDHRWSMRALTAVGGSAVTHVVLGAGMGTDLRRRYGAVEDVLVCSNAGLLGPAKESFDAPGGPGVTLGHLSNLSVEKGIGEVIETLRALRGRGHAARLVLAGPATTPEVEAMIEQAQAELGDALTVLGRIDPDDVDDFYRQIDVFIFPSRYRMESEPLVVLDAARHGISTIAYAVGCVPDLVRPEHLVPVDADFVDHAVTVLTREEPFPPSAETADEFTRRRTIALEAKDQLLHLLLT